LSKLNINIDLIFLIMGKNGDWGLGIGDWVMGI